LILAGDVGGTKILLEVGEMRSGRWDTKLAKRYVTGEADTFAAVLTDFLGEWNRVRGKSDRIDAAGFGIAGPVEGNKGKMTHRPLVVDGDAIESRFLVPKVKVVNDLAAAALGLEGLGPRDLVTVQEGKPVATAPRVVMGIGTGLGIAYVIPGEGGTRVVPGEGGHVGYSPATLRELELWRSVFAAHGRVQAEDIVSGMGLSHVFEFSKGAGPHAKGAPEDVISAEWIAERASRGDLVCTGTLELFLECMGNVAGDHALAVLARGGVYLTGGVTARIHGYIAKSRFSEAFCAKGAFSATMMQIPVYAVTNERVALMGAAKLVM
jgi:glucokinase